MIKTPTIISVGVFLRVVVCHPIQEFFRIMRHRISGHFASELTSIKFVSTNY